MWVRTTKATATKSLHTELRYFIRTSAKERPMIYMSEVRMAACFVFLTTEDSTYKHGVLCNVNTFV